MRNRRSRGRGRGDIVLDDDDLVADALMGKMEDEGHGGQGQGQTGRRGQGHHGQEEDDGAAEIDVKIGDGMDIDIHGENGRDFSCNDFSMKLYNYLIC